MQRPVRGEIYSLYRILLNLELTDSPALMFYIKRPFGREGESVLQTSHLTDHQLLNVPGMAETRWKYTHTTNEQIPVFMHAGHSLEMVNLVDVDATGLEIWATPKGYPRENPEKIQYQ